MNFDMRIDLLEMLDPTYMIIMVMSY